MLYATDSALITLFYMLILIRGPCGDVEELPQGKQALWAYKWLNVPEGQGWHSSSSLALVLLPWLPGGHATGLAEPLGQKYPNGHD